MNQFTQWFFDIPIVTRLFLTTSFMITAFVHLKFLTYFQLYLNYPLVYSKFQFWRLFTNFFYFGDFSFNWFFNMFFIGNYSRMLEEGSFNGRTADFCWMLTLFVLGLLSAGPFLKEPILSSALTFAIVYIWSRRSPDIQIAFLGIFNFRAPYLPFVLITINTIINGRFPYANLASLAIAHIYYFFEDVWPSKPASGGRRLLATPQLFKSMIEPVLLNRPPPRPHED